MGGGQCSKDWMGTQNFKVIAIVYYHFLSIPYIVCFGLSFVSITLLVHIICVHIFNVFYVLILFKTSKSSGWYKM